MKSKQFFQAKNRSNQKYERLLGFEPDLKMQKVCLERQMLKLSGSIVIKKSFCCITEVKFG